MTPAVVVSTYLPGGKPFDSERFDVLPVECVGEFDYWAGVSSVWQRGYTVVNIEQDMERSDDLVAGLLDCPHPLCAYPYKVFPTQLQRYIYCATRDIRTVDEGGKPLGWVVDPGDVWADFSSLGFCKIAPEKQTAPLDKMFWKWFEHSLNRVVTASTQDGPTVTRTRWHLHWPEVQHFHDYSTVPDHLW